MPHMCDIIEAAEKFDKNIKPLQERNFIAFASISAETIQYYFRDSHPHEEYVISLKAK